MRTILVMRGPNLNLPGARGAGIMQSGHESDIVERTGSARGRISGFGKVSYLPGLEAAISLTDE